MAPSENQFDTPDLEEGAAHLADVEVETKKGDLLEVIQ